MTRPASERGPLVRRAAAGDEDAWRELVRQHGRRLVAWLAARPGGDPAIDPEDLAADAWVVAARGIADFSGSDDDFAGWLFGIARNLARNDGRRARRRRTDPRAVEDDAGEWGVVAGPEQQVVGERTTRELLALLSPREAEAVAAVDVAGLDVATAARVLGTSTTALRVARHRGLGRLRRALAPDRRTD